MKLFYKLTNGKSVMWVAYDAVDTTVEATLLRLQTTGWTITAVSSEEFIPY